MNKVTYKSISKEKKSAQAEFDFPFKNEKLVFLSVWFIYFDEFY